MRPHYLQLTAFGPFANEVEIDFDRLGEGGLFLMHGETGAGKTTVLDALSFALYGRVPGIRGVGRLRSDHAGPTTRTSVRLEVSLAGRRLRITRTPAQERPKLRGAGVTSEPASVQLDEWDDASRAGWRPRSTRVGEVDAELSELLGMSAEQFHQVVLLPQGQFARFLHSDAGERAQLLQRLFGTDRFRRIEDWLAEQRRQTKEAFEEARHRVRRLVARVAQVCDEDEPDELPDVDWAASQLARAQEAAAAAARDAADARSRHESAQRKAAEVTDLARRQGRRREALDRQRRVEGGAAAVAAAQAEIRAARRAAGVSEALQAQTRRFATAEHARLADEQSRSTLTEDLRPASIEQLRLTAAADREMLGRLEEAVATERGVATAAAELAGLAKSIADDRRRAQALTAIEAAAAVARPAAQQRLAAARDAVSRLPAATAAADRAREAVAAAQTRDALRLDVARLSAEHLAAREAVVDRRASFNALRNDRIDGMIAELASKLEDDTPCPVCGALEHPDPSELVGRSVSKADEEAAATTADAAQAHVAAVGEQLASARSACEAAEARLRQLGHKAAADIALLGMARETAAAAAEQLAVDAADVEVAERELAEFDAQGLERREELARLDAGIATAQRQAATVEQRQAELQQRLDVLLGGRHSVLEARVVFGREVEALDAAEVASAAAARAADELAAANERAERAAMAAGFAGVADAQAALRDPQTIERLEAEVRHAHEEAATIAELLADPELDVTLEPVAPVADANEDAQRALVASREAEQRLATAAQRVEQLVQLRHELAERLVALEPVAAAARRAKELADLAGGIGANRLNMALSAYVLAARLEEVAEAASHRLRAMSQGRYTLMHSDSRTGNGRSGLRLLVCDAWTGQDRDTATLSGGETFLASLALALGLAEVVTASAGGAPLEALFIDEGFGTLDEETLDEVLDVLDGLREGGRLVGIVSHVPHLRDRIPSQLRVRKGSAGSALAQTDGAGDEFLPPRPVAPPAPAADVLALPDIPAEIAEIAEVAEVVDVVSAPASEQLALLGAD